MNKIKINNYILRNEKHSADHFNLYVLTKIKSGSKKGDLREVNIAYGVKLNTALKIIASREAYDSNIIECQKLIKFQTKRFEELSSKLLNLGHKLWDKIENDRPKKKINTNGLKKYRDERNKSI